MHPPRESRRETGSPPPEHLSNARCELHHEAAIRTADTPPEISSRLRRETLLNANRRRLPRVEVTKDYVFEGPDGEVSLLDLFEGRRQLIVPPIRSAARTTTST